MREIGAHKSTCAAVSRYVRPSTHIIGNTMRRCKFAAAQESIDKAKRITEGHDTAVSAPIIVQGKCKRHDLPATRLAQQPGDHR